jgi:hypothetical protein
MPAASIIAIGFDAFLEKAETTKGSLGLGSGRLRFSKVFPRSPE